jgi:type II secretory pathway pseudopilin PulG
LVELLIVILIVLLVSAIALPTILPAIGHRQVSEAARIVQAALAGARDSAIHSGNPAGVRLLIDPVINGINPTTGLLDPTQPLAANRIIPLEPAPDYTEGMVSIINDPPLAPPYPFSSQPPWPGPGGGVYPYPPPLNKQPPAVLMVEQCPVNPATGVPNEPTSWFWNIRVGERISIGNAGQQYVVVGPMTVPPLGTTINGTPYANPELFVNDGPPGTTSLARTYRWTAGNPPQPVQQLFHVEYLFLVNVQDDDKDGFVDNGWDGVDNNLNVDINGNPIIDELLEWTEAENWMGALAPSNLHDITGNLPDLTPGTTGILNQPYTITRRPVPSSKGREIALPSNVVIDLTTWDNGALGIGPPERSRVPAQALNQFSGTIDILVYPGGAVVPTTIYSSPASFGLSGSYFHLWLAERSDVVAPNPNVTTAPFLPIGTIDGTLLAKANLDGLGPYKGPVLKGQYRLVTLFSRTGQVVTSDDVPFDDPALAAFLNRPYNPSLPYLRVQQGLTGGQ